MFAYSTNRTQQSGMENAKQSPVFIETCNRKVEYWVKGTWSWALFCSVSITPGSATNQHCICLEEFGNLMTWSVKQRYRVADRVHSGTEFTEFTVAESSHSVILYSHVLLFLLYPISISPLLSLLSYHLFSYSLDLSPYIFFLCVVSISHSDPCLSIPSDSPSHLPPSLPHISISLLSQFLLASLSSLSLLLHSPPPLPL